MTALPWDKWYWTDYEADEGLRMCTLAAQGLWLRMLSLMARATPKGDLRVGGEPCTVTDLARAVGESEEMVATLLAELDRRGVYSTTRMGVIYNRRMRKDAVISAKRARAGAKGAESTNRKYKDNPDLPQQKPGKASGKSPAPEARSQKPEEERTPKPPQLPADVRSVMEEAGFVSPPPDLGMIQDWYAAGATLEQDILPSIRRVRPRLDRTPFRLKVFDAAIREKLADDAAEMDRLAGIARRLQAADEGQAAAAGGGR